MNHQHLLVRLDQCRMLSMLSPCVRARVGAMLLDPVHNVVLMDGYNSGPPHQETPVYRHQEAPPRLCRGAWCERRGFLEEDVEIVAGRRHQYQRVGGSVSLEVIKVQTRDGGHLIKSFDKQMLENLNEPSLFGPIDFPAKKEGEPEGPFDELAGKHIEQTIPSTRQRAEAWVDQMVKKYPPLEAGVCMERGCHHAEMNVITSAAAKGVCTEGALLIITGEPCLMCAKYVHKAGIGRVVFVAETYGDSSGKQYLEDTKSIQVEHYTHAQINEMARKLRKKTPGTNPA